MKRFILNNPSIGFIASIVVILYVAASGFFADSTAAFCFVVIAITSVFLAFIMLENNKTKRHEALKNRAINAISAFGLPGSEVKPTNSGFKFTNRGKIEYDSNNDMIVEPITTPDGKRIRLNDMRHVIKSNRQAMYEGRSGNGGKPQKTLSDLVFAIAQNRKSWQYTTNDSEFNENALIWKASNGTLQIAILVGSDKVYENAGKLGKNQWQETTISKVISELN